MTYIIYLQLHDEAHFVPVFTNFLLQVLIIATFFVQQQLTLTVYLLNTFCSLSKHGDCWPKNVTNLFAMYLMQSNKQNLSFLFNNRFLYLIACFIEHLLIDMATRFLKCQSTYLCLYSFQCFFFFFSESPCDLN